VPIYDYVCSQCGHRFEVLHGLNEAGPRHCPGCGGAVSRAFAPPTILFKGSGWARMDRRATSGPRREPKARPEDGPGRPAAPEAPSAAPPTSGEAKPPDGKAGDA
jgi:putative FmdB family regulatory protein